MSWGEVIWQNNILRNNVQIFTSNGTFTVPNQVETIYITACGGGGGGGAAGENHGGGGGGGGEMIVQKSFHVTPKQTIDITIGKGGTGSNGRKNAANGTATVIGNLVTLAGGQGAQDDGHSVIVNGGQGGTGAGNGGNGMIDSRTAANRKEATNGENSKYYDFSSVYLKYIGDYKNSTGGVTVTDSTSNGYGGGGGGSIGKGGNGGTDVGNQENGVFGGGGGGAYSTDDISYGNAKGANGGNGIVIIEWGGVLGEVRNG